MAIGAMAAAPAGASAALVYDEAPEWITPQSLGHYAADPDSPGPKVAVDVPNAGGGKGYIEVWAQVKANAHQTAIGLFDITGKARRFVSGQDTLCSETASPPLRGDLFMTLDGVPGIYGTPMGLCAPATGAPGPVLLHVTAGQRRFRLDYADCGCGGKPAVSHRKLWIRPVPAE